MGYMARVVRHVVVAFRVRIKVRVRGQGMFYFKNIKTPRCLLSLNPVTVKKFTNYIFIHLTDFKVVGKAARICTAEGTQL